MKKSTLKIEIEGTPGLTPIKGKDYFTSKENSKKEDLLHALQILIQNNLAYEL